MTTFKPGPGYPTTDFINAPRESDEERTWRWKRERDEARAHVRELVEMLEATLKRCGLCGGAINDHSEACRGCACAWALLSRVRGG